MVVLEHPAPTRGITAIYLILHGASCVFSLVLSVVQVSVQFTRNLEEQYSSEKSGVVLLVLALKHFDEKKEYSYFGDSTLGGTVMDVTS